MTTRTRSALVLAAALVLVAVPRTFAQEPAAGVRPKDALHVFLDCAANCDEEYLRREITIIEYVRERTVADVHVIVTTRATGGGGTEYELRFIGLGEFDGIDHTLTYVAPQASTDDERRSGMAEAFKRGLVRYLSATTLGERVMVAFTPPPMARPDGAHDPWNLWVFAVNVSGTASGEESNRLASIRAGTSANRTTEAWRLGLSLDGNYADDRFELSETRSFRSLTRGIRAGGQAVKSLTPHWSAALTADAGSSTFVNYDLRARVAPGVEFNVFPYQESTRRMLTLQYSVGFNSMDYHEETIFGRTSERLLDHQVIASLSMRQPWGSSSAQVSFFQFVNEPDKYNLGAFADANVRLVKGLSLSAHASVNRTRDQIYLPREGATAEEILVRQQQLATGYRYTLTFGVTYTFGSVFNNVVNPRFGARGGGFEAF